MIKTHKNQHIIPQCYLGLWADPDCPQGQTPFVWITNKGNGITKNKAPKNLFKQNDFYSIYDDYGNRDLYLENILNSFEDRFMSIIQDKIKNEKRITLREKADLCVFLAAMHARTLNYHNHIKQQASQIFKRFRDIKRYIDAHSIDNTSCIKGPPAKGQVYSAEEIENLFRHPTQSVLMPYVKRFFKVLFQLDLAILIANNNNTFITSDDPCVYFDPSAYDRPPLLRYPMLTSINIEVSFPVTPFYAIVLNRKGLHEYVVAENEIIDGINKRTLCVCKEDIVTQKKNHKIIQSLLQNS